VSFGQGCEADPSRLFVIAVARLVVVSGVMSAEKVPFFFAWLRWCFIAHDYMGRD
jgi:hypothetical protein